MAKSDEINFFEALGEDGRRHSLGKPFSDKNCGLHLAGIGTILMLLPPPPARILDMGCGAGWTSVFFAKCGYDIVGMDISQISIDMAYENKTNNNVGENLSFIVSDYESFNVSELFDAVIFFDCLHHADDERAAMASAFRALKPSGVLITHEPGEGHASNPDSIRAMELYGVTEKDMPPHLIIKHGLELGFVSQRIYPMQDQVLHAFGGGVQAVRKFKRSPWALIKRAWKGAFRPWELSERARFQASDRASAIVVLTKGHYKDSGFA